LWPTCLTICLFNGYSLAFILVASYDHHQEHLEKLLAWLTEHGN